MKVYVCDSAEQLGARAAADAAGILRAAIAKNGTARMVMSTGASQFTTIAALINADVDWHKVEMFHLDEFIGIGPDHPASFIKYLKERFVSKVSLRAAHFVDLSEGVNSIIGKLTDELNKAPIDLGIIGIGENAHIAFNDPPADFDTDEAYKVVDLDQACRNQQYGEGWFATLDEVPKQAVSMTVRRIMQCDAIISAVPYAVKAKAVAATLARELSNMVPATMLKTHAHYTLYLDKDSASLADLAPYGN